MGEQMTIDETIEARKRLEGLLAASRAQLAADHTAMHKRLIDAQTNAMTGTHCERMAAWPALSRATREVFDEIDRLAAKLAEIQARLDYVEGHACGCPAPWCAVHSLQAEK
jgi:hypothetical protein